MTERSYDIAGAGIALVTPLSIVWTTVIRGRWKGDRADAGPRRRGGRIRYAVPRAGDGASHVGGGGDADPAGRALVATAPSIIETNGGMGRAPIFDGTFALFWLATATSFLRAAAVATKRPRS